MICWQVAGSPLTAVEMILTINNLSSLITITQRCGTIPWTSHLSNSIIWVIMQCKSYRSRIFSITYNANKINQLHQIWQHWALFIPRISSFNQSFVQQLEQLKAEWVTAGDRNRNHQISKQLLTPDLFMCQGIRLIEWIRPHQ